MASVSYKSSAGTLTPLSGSYDTGGSTGAAGGGVTGYYLNSRANEFIDGKVDTDEGSSTYKNVHGVLTPLSGSYDTGGSTGAAGGGVTGYCHTSKGVRTLSPAEGGSGPVATTLSAVEFTFTIEDDALVTEGASFGDARVTQYGVEVAMEGAAGDARVTQYGIEVAMEAGTAAARITQYGVEAALEGLPGDARVTQFGVEVAMFDDRPELFNSIPSLAPLDGADGKPLLPLLKIYLDNGEIRYFSQVGVVAGEQPYEPGVLNFGSINREIDPQGTGFRISEFQVEFDNSTGEWSRLKSLGLTGRTVQLLLGDPTADASTFRLIYTGIIAPRWTLNRRSFVVTIQDVFSNSLETPLLIPVDIFSFPFLPDSEPGGGMVPIVFGEHLEGEGRRVGQLPAFLIDPQFTSPVLGPDSFRYVACQGDIESVDQVFVKGVLQTEGVDYAVVEESGSGLFFTADTVVYLDFAADPRDDTAHDPNEDRTQGFDVTWSGKGFKDADTGLVIKNPATQLFEFMRKHTADFRNGDPFVVGVDREQLGLNTSDFDAASISAAELLFQQLGIESSFAVTSTEETLRSVLDKFAESFGLVVTSSIEGKIRFTVRTEEAVTPGLVPHLVEGAHLVRDTAEYTSMTDVLGSASIEYDPDYVLGGFYDKVNEVSSDGNSQNLGSAGSFTLWYVRADTARATIVSQLLFFAEEARVISVFKCDPHLHDDFSVGDLIALTEGAGPTEDGLGFRARFMRVTSVGFDFSSLTETTMNVRAVDIRGFGTGGDGSEYRTFSDTFVTVSDPIGIETESLFSTTLNAR